MASNRVDVSAIIERQKLSGFLIALVVTSWIITFFDGYDMNVIGFAAPYFAKQFDLTRVMIGNVFSAGTFGLLVGGFLLGYLGDKAGRRPAIILSTSLPVRSIFAILAVCPAVVLICVIMIGRIHTRLLREESTLQAQRT